MYTPGQEVTWIHQPRGGYGYTMPVPARIVKINAKTVRIAAKLRNGGTKEVNVVFDIHQIDHLTVTK